MLHCFFAWCALFKVDTFHFFAGICPQRSAFEHTCLLNFVNSKVSKQTKRCEMVIHLNISKLKVGVNHSISRRATFSPNPHFVEEVFCFPFLSWFQLNYIAMCLCNKDPDFLFLLNRFFVYSLPTAMSSVTGNHTMDLFYLLKENFKNLLQV